MEESGEFELWKFRQAKEAKPITLHLSPAVVFVSVCLGVSTAVWEKAGFACYTAMVKMRPTTKQQIHNRLPRLLENWQARRQE